MKPSVLPPELSKTVYFTSRAVFDSGFAIVTAGLLSNGGFTTVPVDLNSLFFLFSMNF